MTRFRQSRAHTVPSPRAGARHGDAFASRPSARRPLFETLLAPLCSGKTPRSSTSTGRAGCPAPSGVRSPGSAGTICPGLSLCKKRKLKNPQNQKAPRGRWVSRSAPAAQSASAPTASAAPSATVKAAARESICGGSASKAASRALQPSTNSRRRASKSRSSLTGIMA